MKNIMQIITSPNPLLLTRSDEIDLVNDSIRELMDNMLITMRQRNGIGLAAIQVGVCKRVIVIDIDSSNQGQNLHHGIPIFIANPKIIYQSDEQESMIEGCLSIPSVSSSVQRSHSIIIEYLDYNNKKQKLSASHSILAACIQHEIDHLNGKLFTDHLSKLKKSLLLTKYRKHCSKLQKLSKHI